MKCFRTPGARNAQRLLVGKEHKGIITSRKTLDGKKEETGRMTGIIYRK